MTSYVTLDSIPEPCLIRILEFSHTPGRLSQTCRRIQHLWRLESVQTTWLITRLGHLDALEAALAVMRVGVVEKLLCRYTYTPLRLAHYLVDIAAARIPIEEEQLDRVDDVSVVSPFISTTSNHREAITDTRRDGDRHNAAPYDMSRQSTTPIAHSSTSSINVWLGLPPIGTNTVSTAVSGRLAHVLINHGADLSADLSLYMRSLLFTTPFLTFSDRVQMDAMPHRIDTNHHDNDNDDGNNDVLVSADSHIHLIMLINEAQGQAISAGTAALFFACWTGQHEVIRELLVAHRPRRSDTDITHGDVDVFAVDPTVFGDIAITVACAEGRTRVVRTLLHASTTQSQQSDHQHRRQRHVIDPRARNGMPLRLAQRRGFHQIVHMLQTYMSSNTLQ